MAKALAEDLQARTDAGIELLTDATLPRLREFASIPQQPLPSSPIHHCEDRIIPGCENEITIRIYRPSDQDNLPVLMWFHGGGWVIGSLDDADDVCRKISHQSECIVVSADYHLAPETRFPIALEDCFAATRWVKDHASDLRSNASRIALGGDSAGGNLAACTAIKCREENIPVVFQLLIYPVIDADFERSSYQDYADNVNLTRADMQWFWDCYVPETRTRRNPLASPIHAPELSNLPPALIITAECDPLCDEGKSYAQALKSAGIPVRHHSFPGMIHGFFNRPVERPVKAIEESFALATRSLKIAFSNHSGNGRASV